MKDCGVLVHSMPIKPDMADLSDDDLAQIMSKAMTVILVKMEDELEVQGVKSWQYLSHSLTRLDRHLLLSVLVQKNS